MVKHKYSNIKECCFSSLQLPLTFKMPYIYPLVSSTLDLHVSKQLNLAL